LPSVISGSTDPKTFFTSGFLERVPAERFQATNAQMLKNTGPIKSVRLVAAETPFVGVVEVSYEGTKSSMRISVDPAAPHLVNGLRMLGNISGESNIGAVIAALRALPGQTALAVARLDDTGPKPTMQINADKVLAIGSEFKLIVLGELVRAINAGERKWDDQALIGDQQLPSGSYYGKPANTKIALRELAERMISSSDNSATDILLNTLGREKVEAMMPVMGIKDPSRNMPLLFTLEANKLKGRSEKKYGELWRTLDEPGKRALLASEIATARVMTANQAAAATQTDGKTTAPASSPSPSANPAAAQPRLIESVEWFASPSDMIRVMDWLRRNTESGPAAEEARAILSRSPGLPPSATGPWDFVGYKGGSEAGVIAQTFLLKGRDDQWYAVSAKWNNTDAAVDNTRFAGLISRLIELTAPK